MPKFPSENTTTATAMPFWAFKDINIFSFKSKFIPLNENTIEKNLMNGYRENSKMDFMKNSIENGIFTISPISRIISR